MKLYNQVNFSLGYAFFRLFPQRKFYSMKKTKKFDCVEMKNRIQGKIYEDIKGMTLEEEHEYRRKKIEDGSLADLYKKI
ncbi:MAG: hypothetical protein C5B49_15335 [Bdellovibrio sp.]|nr:MAG: hypothetical protein C5B49_15335 [Bdellovibrio sp.]